MHVLAALIASSAIAFTAPPGRLVVTAPGYTLQLSAHNGRILSLNRKGQQLLHGGFGCMWDVNPNHHATKIGGCAFDRTGARRFSYRWDARTSTLTETWTGKDVGTVTVTLAARASSFDLQLTMKNGGPVRDEVRFPSGLAGDTRIVEAGYVPEVLPGVKLSPRFFREVHNTVQIYPSRWAFADWLALDTGAGSVALYTVYPGGIAPTQLGFIHTGAHTTCSGIAYCIVHEFETWVRPGQTWGTPVVRVVVGEPVQQAILDYRRDNRIDAYPAASSKLGALMPTLSRAVLVKADMPKLAPFATLARDVAALPAPVLLHPVAYQQGGHDNNDPDFLPPDPSLGTTADFSALIAAAHANGDLVMPYANASWWDPASPTMQANQVKDVAVLDQHGTPVAVAYGPRAGVIVSPYATAVKQRFARQIGQFTTDVPSDCVFLDQIGARPWLRDFNAASPDPLAYDDGWLDLVAPYRSRCLMVEDGWDHLARDAAAFHGSLLMMERELGLPDTFFGAGNWQPYPIATLLFHDKVLMYQHDLYPGTMATDGTVLTWNAAFGLIGSYEWKLGDESDPWLALASLLQRDLGPHYAGVALSSWTPLADGVARSVFGDLTVVSNLSAAPYQDIPPGGFRATTADGSLQAGAYVGGHWLVVERAGGTITVRQPVGADMQVTVQSSASSATAIASDGSVVGTVPVSGGTFEYAQVLNGKPVAAYRLSA